VSLPTNIYGTAGPHDLFEHEQWHDTLHENYNNAWINVQSSPFNATGDGTTDDASAIQAAIDALPDFGGTLLFPNGNYYVGTGLVNNGKTCVKVLGVGGRRERPRIVSGVPGIWLLTVGTGAATSQVTGWSIEHMGFQDRSTSFNQIGGGVKFYGAWNNQVLHSTFSNMRVGTAISIAANSGTLATAQYNIVRDPHIEDCLNGIICSGSNASGSTNDTLIEGGEILGSSAIAATSGSIGVSIRNSSRFSNCNVQGFETNVVVESSGNHVYATRHDRSLGTPNVHIDVQGGNFNKIMFPIFGGGDPTTAYVRVGASAVRTYVVGASDDLANSSKLLVDSGTDTWVLDQYHNAGKVKAGVPADSDFTYTPKNGTTVLDSTNSRLYVRVGGVWKYAALT
jgi:hypothetical protein